MTDKWEGEITDFEAVNVSLSDDLRQRVADGELTLEEAAEIERERRNLSNGGKDDA